MDCGPGFVKIDAAVAHMAAMAPKRVETAIGMNIQRSRVKLPHLEIEMQQPSFS
jgi:hypothetical protein